MRLSSNQIKAGILHPEKGVRDAAVFYFANSFSTDPTVMLAAIGAIEKYGWRDGISDYAFGEGLAQNEETMVWLLTELRRVAPSEDPAWSGYQATLRRLLAAADTHLLRKYEAELASIGLADTSFRAAIHDRIRFLSTDSETLWRELEAYCDRIRGSEYLSEVNLDPAYHLVEAIAREGDKYTERILELLENDVPEEIHDLLAWLQPLAVRVAGEMRLEAAVPLIVEKLHDDADWLDEECQRALIKIGTDEVVESVFDAFPVAPWHFRLFAAGTLAGIHTDLSVRRCLDLLCEEEDGDLQVDLGRALLAHFAYDAIEPMRQMILDRRNDAEILAVQEELVMACTLMGVEFPEFHEWKEEVVNTIQWRQRVLTEEG